MPTSQKSVNDKMYNQHFIESMINETFKVLCVKAGEKQLSVKDEKFAL